MSLKEKVIIPNYTLGEELCNAISHGIGVGLSITALVLCVVRSAIHGSAMAVVASSIYGSMMIILYLMSTLYHSLKVNNAKRVFNIIDHCSIYLLIAGSYTPYTLVSLRGALGWTIFGIIWGCAILGIVLNAVDLNKFKKASLISYIIMGWFVVIGLVPLTKALGFGGMLFLVLGGISYTIGAILYAVGKKHKYMHSLFHLFVLIGSILQFFSIYFYVI